MIYLSNQIRATRRQGFESIDLECIWIEIDNHTFSYLLCCIYRPPNSDNTFWTKLSWSLDKVSEYSDKIIIVGDLNVDFFKIPLTHNIREIISTYDLANNISVATRNRALLDPILTSSEIQSCESGVLGMEQTVSDHSATYISVISNINYRRAYRRKIWIYKNADFTKLNTLIENCNWANINIGIGNRKFHVKISFLYSRMHTRKNHNSSTAG